MPVPEFFHKTLELIDEGVIFIDAAHVIRYWNKGAERMTGFLAAELINKPCIHGCLRFQFEEHDNVCKATCGLDKVFLEGREQTSQIYFQHKEGHRFPVKLRMVPFHETPGAPATGMVEVFSDESLSRRLTDESEELRRQALLDPLTELSNRRYAEMQLARQFEELHRYGQPFGLAFIDIDQFKSLNDTHGHNAGDRVLRSVGRTLLHNVRAFDTVSRWGGEEFTAIIVKVDRPQLFAVAEKLRILVAASSIQYGNSILQAKVSVGITMVRAGEDGAALINRADQAMYESKRAGGNRVTWG